MYPAIDITQFELLFRQRYRFLCLVSFRIVKDEDISRDMVQEFFLNVWQRKESIDIQGTFKSYTSGAVRNLSLLYLRSDKKKQTAYKIYGEREDPADGSVQQEEMLEREQIDLRVMEKVDLLPADRRKIFLDYAVEGLSYQQIAEKYNISINTVKTQMKRAYSFLKAEISDDLLGVILLSILISR